jgi:hypothetical protein
MMTTRELLENASLDALGLLEDEEREAFETAFRSATPEIQSQIRREQLRVAEMDRFLPDVEPPAGLRARVLAAVREAIAAVAPGSVDRDTSPVYGPPILGITLRATPVWRAACIGFATATVVLSASFAWMTHQNRQMSSLTGSNEVLGELHDSLGARGLDILARAAVRPVAFESTDVATASTVAQIYLDPDTGEALLLAKGLPASKTEYRLVVRNPDDSHTRLDQFQSTGGTVAHVFVCDPRALSGVEIHGAAEDGLREKVLLKLSGV